MSQGVSVTVGEGTFGGFKDDVFESRGLVEDQEEPVALLWSPAKAWGLVFDHGIMSIRQVRSREGSLKEGGGLNSKCWRRLGSGG